MLGLGLVGGLVAGLLGLDRLPLTLCYFKALSGWPCLSCGATRAVARLALLDVRAALAMNPLAAFGGLALVPWGLSDAVLMVRGRALRASLAPSLHRGARWLVVSALAANWVYLLAVGR